MSQKSRVRSPHGARVLDRGCSSNGRASALHAEGTGIDTLLLHFFATSFLYLLSSILGRVVKALDLSPSGLSPRGFEPRRMQNF